MFKEPYLVQRLNKPHNPERMNPFVFGGGLRNGGLSEEEAKELSMIFAFEYMGAAEYEFGAVPKALSSIWEAGQKGDLEAWEFEIPATSVKLTSWLKNEGWSVPEKTIKVYALAPKELKADIEAFILSTAKEDKTRDECVMFWRAFAVKEGSDPYKLGGWLELDNGFMFFADRPMWEQMTAKMGGKVHA